MSDLYWLSDAQMFPYWPMLHPFLGGACVERGRYSRQMIRRVTARPRYLADLRVMVIMRRPPDPDQSLSRGRRLSQGMTV